MHPQLFEPRLSEPVDELYRFCHYGLMLIHSAAFKIIQNESSHATVSETYDITNEYKYNIILFG